MAGILKVDEISEATQNDGVILNNNVKVRLADNSTQHLISTSGNTTTIDNISLGSNTIPNSSFMFRNKIINGGMQIDQRNSGASVGPFASASAGYKGVDRWFIASDPMTSQQITGNTPTGFSHYLKLTKGSGSNIDIRQTVELPAAGQAGQFSVGSVWTLSFYAKSVAGGETLNFSTYFRAGVATGTFTAVSAPTPSSVILTTNWTRYSVLFTIDVSPGSNDLCIAFGLNTTATELHLTGVQLEEGTVATPFEHRPYGLELSLCQRYFCKTGQNIFIGRGNSNSAVFGVTTPVSMRSTPTITITNGNIVVYDHDSNESSSTDTVTVNGSTTYDGFGFRCHVSGVSAPNNRVHAIESEGNMTFSSEL